MRKVLGILSIAAVIVIAGCQSSSSSASASVRNAAATPSSEAAMPRVSHSAAASVAPTTARTLAAAPTPTADPKAVATPSTLGVKALAVAPVIAPVAAVSCSAAMTNASPHHNQTTMVDVTTLAGAQVTAVAHYKTTNTPHSAVANAAGRAGLPFDISTASVGFAVHIDITVTLKGASGSCSTSFTPVPAVAVATAPVKITVNPLPPTPPNDAPPGATARCNDGSYSYAAHHQGACSHHGGVAVFLT
jgi:hypothetical protein